MGTLGSPTATLGRLDVSEEEAVAQQVDRVFVFVAHWLAAQGMMPASHWPRAALRPM